VNQRSAADRPAAARSRRTTAGSRPVDDDEVFRSAAELFSLLSTPIRLKIISVLCNGERNVSELREAINTSQPNMSQHLAALYRSGVLSKRREGTQIYYGLQSEPVANLCRAVCVQYAIEQDGSSALPRPVPTVPGNARRRSA
jgi:DNA-binding transcriptional ArsR family regulator